MSPTDPNPWAILGLLILCIAIGLLLLARAR